jgi:hypothetical protein
MKKGGIFVIVVCVLLLIVLSYFLVSKTSSNETNNIFELNGSSVSEKNDFMAEICENSLGDYPEWTKYETDILVWENSNKEFNFRNSPEDSSAFIASPAESSEVLDDMEFVDMNEFAYIKHQNEKWKIGLFKINGLDAPTNNIIFETEDNLDYVDISPINKKRFIVLSEKEGEVYFNLLDTEKLTNENILQIPSSEAEISKLAVSPSGNYAYLLYGGILRIVEIESKIKLDEISSVKSVVWVGNSHLLYSDDEVIFIYEIGTKEKKKIQTSGSVSELSFSPLNEGVISYNFNSGGEIVDCQTWNKLKELDEGEIHTFSSEKTVIIERDSDLMYWRFKTDWTLVPSHIPITNYATVWKRY